MPKRPGSPPLDAIHKTEHRWIEGSETAGLGRLLAYLNPMKMALKGGTGIRKVFIENYRFSDDLDFTLLEIRG